MPTLIIYKENFNKMSKTTLSLLATLFTLSIIESYRFVTILFPLAYRHRLSCYFTHFVTLSCYVLLSIEVLSYSNNGDNVSNFAGTILSNRFIFNSTLSIISHFSDCIAVMFSVLMVAFTRNKSNIITPLENEKVDAFRIISNLYLHYGPSLVFWLVRNVGYEGPLGLEDEVITNDLSICISSGLIILWTIAYWGEVDACYGLKYKGAGKSNKDGSVRDLIVPYIMVVIVPYLGIRKNMGW